MPSNQPYTTPGVYVEEIDTGARTIAGLDTTITAFIGRAQRGPVNTAVTVNNFGEFTRVFGGLWLNSVLGHALKDYFENGGSRAVVVRVFHCDAAADCSPAAAGDAYAGDESLISHTARLIIGGMSGDLVLQAKNPGSWANHLTAQVSVIDDQAMREAVAERYGLTKQDYNELFDLTIDDTATGKKELFRNLTLRDGGPRYIEDLLSASELITVTRIPDAPPVATTPLVEVEAPVTDGISLDSNDFLGDEKCESGLYAFEQVDLFSLLCIPPYGDSGVDVSVLKAAAKYCKQRRAILLVDPPSGWGVQEAMNYRNALSLSGSNAAFYFPRVLKANPLHANRVEEFTPSASVAGVIVRTDRKRGVWKSPAGTEAVLSGFAGLAINLSEEENSQLNPLGVNCLRTFAGAGHLVWGARTVDGDDRLQSDWKYLAVRRTALFIEESLHRGTAWAVFEPNDEALWSSLRADINAFMMKLFRQGAFQGTSTEEAFFVRCDRETMTRTDIEQGHINIEVGFAPLRPAEFIVLRMRHKTGEASS